MHRKNHRPGPLSSKMMIAFVTLKVVEYPILRVYVARIRVLDIMSHLLLFCFGRKDMLKKKQLVQDLIPLCSILIHMCALYTCTNTFMLRFSPSGFFGPSGPGVASRDFWMGIHPSTLRAVCVCVCAYTHTYTHIHSHPRQIIEKS